MVYETKNHQGVINVAFENVEVKILNNERVMDTDPELYKRRALDALEKEYFSYRRSSQKGESCGRQISVIGLLDEVLF